MSEAQTRYLIDLQNAGRSTTEDELFTKVSNDSCSELEDTKIVEVDDEPNVKSFPLLSQLKRIPTNARLLKIDADVPTDEEWALLGDHFTSVEDLEVDAGFHEDLNDQLMPKHWPLRRLSVVSSCGEVIRNPHILLGKVRHLILCFTSGIRFEGPTSNELVAADKRAIARGEKKEEKYGRLTIISIPDLVYEWTKAKYEGQEIRLPGPGITSSQDMSRAAPIAQEAEDLNPIALMKLEILENDAIAAFMRFSIALPQLAYNLHTLNIRSTNGCDLKGGGDPHESLFGPILASLDQLETLVLTIGDVFDGEGVTLPTMYQHLPSNVRTLRIRGPLSLTRHEEWPDWISRFSDPAFLPHLERISFVCDMEYDVLQQDAWRSTKRAAIDEDLDRSKNQCARLLDAVRAREFKEGGKRVVVERFVEKWTQAYSSLDAVDSRWEDL